MNTDYTVQAVTVAISFLLDFVFLSSAMYHLFTLLLVLASAAGDGNFSFTDTHVTVRETPFTQANFGIARTGGQAESVFLTCEVGIYHITFISPLPLLTPL